MKSTLSAKRKLELYKLADIEAGNMKKPGIVWPDDFNSIPAADEIDSEEAKLIEEQSAEEQPSAEPATDAERALYWQAVAEKRKSLFELLVEQFKALESKQKSIETLGGKIEEQGEQTRKTIAKQKHYRSKPEQYARLIREIANELSYYERMRFSAQTVRNYRRGRTKQIPPWFFICDDLDKTRLRHELQIEKIQLEQDKKDRQTRDALRRPEALPDEM